MKKIYILSLFITIIAFANAQENKMVANPGKRRLESIDSRKQIPLAEEKKNSVAGEIQHAIPAERRQRNAGAIDYSRTGVNNGRLPSEEELRIKQDRLNSIVATPNLNAVLRNDGGLNMFATGPEQDCSGAIAVCQPSYNQSNSYTGYGSIQEVYNTCLSSQERQSVWYVFTVQDSGTFNFTLNTTNDYDFALYNITSIGCSGVPSATPVRCNFSATYGSTGLTLPPSASATLSVGAGGSPTMPGLNVTAGQTFALIIDNFTQDNNGYTLTFGGTASIFDNTPPSITSATTTCSTNSIVVNFSENVDCSSLDIADFTLTGPGGAVTINSVTGSGCATNGLTQSATIVYSSAGLINGAYTFATAAGATIYDKCGSNITPFSTAAGVFDTPPTITGITSSCTANTITVTFSKPIQCSALGASDFDLTGPNGAVSITSVAGISCTAAGLATQALITYNGTGLVNGTYTIATSATSDITDNCHTNTTAFSGTFTKFAETISLTATPGQVCSGSSSTINIQGDPASGATYNWSPVSGTDSTVTVTPSTNTTYNVAVTYGGCVKNGSVTVQITQPPVVQVNPSNVSLCSGTTSIIAGATINGAACPDCDYQWSGSSSQSDVGVASSTLTGVGSGTYTVTVTSSTGCVGNSATSTVSIAAPSATPSCNIIYVSPAGGGDGLTKATPTTIQNALTLAVCNNATIKMQIGDYSISSPLDISGLVTIEGGYNTSFTQKTSGKATGGGFPAQGTRIIRSTANPDGIAPNQRLIALNVAPGASYFRFQDLMITVSNPAAQSSITNYAIYLGSGCHDYDIVRCVIDAGTGGSGTTGASGVNGVNGGDGGAGGNGPVTGDYVPNGWNNGAGGTSAVANQVGGSGGYGGIYNTQWYIDVDNSNTFNSPPDILLADVDSGCAGYGGGASQYSNPRGGGKGGEGDYTSGWQASHDGSPGTAGINGTNGTNGTNGSTGSYSGGFYVLGTSGTNGTDGTDGTRGTGGGGGGMGDDFWDGIAQGGGGGGGGGAGQKGTGGAGGGPAGGAFGIFSVAKGVNGTVTDCDVSAAAGTGGSGGTKGTKGTGGAAGPGGTGLNADSGNGADGGKGGDGGDGGSGGNGGDGLSCLVCDLNGAVLTTIAHSNFGLPAQPVITADNVSCLNTNITYNTTASGSPAWNNFGANSNPASGTTVPDTTQYSVIGRKDIVLDIPASTATIAAQTFTNTAATGNVVDNCGGTINNSITVSGYTGTVATTNITVNVTASSHTFLSDVSLFLVASDGSILGLTNNRGNGGTCALSNITFSTAGAAVMGATCPAAGSTFKPETAVYTDCGTTSTVTSFGAIGGGSLNPNGTWTLRIVDNVGGDVGAAVAIGGWSISFPSYTVPVPASTSSYTGFTNIVIPPPSAGTIIASATTICPDTVNVFSSVAGTPGFTYSWTVSPSTGVTILNFDSSATGIILPNTTANPIVYTVSQHITSECCGLLTAVTKDITVNPIPEAPATVDLNVCTGGSGDLLVTAPANHTINWYTTSSGGASFNTGYTYTVNPAASNQTYYVDATNTGGCVGPRAAINVVVTPDPAPTVVDATVCTGGSATMSVTAPAGATYNWYAASSGGASLNTGDTYTISPANSNQTFYVDAVTSAGCTGPRAAVNVTVTPNTAPAAINATSCDTGYIDVSVTPMAGSVTYNWYDAPAAGNLLQSGVSPGYSVYVGTLGTTVTVYASATVAGCNESALTPVTATVSNNPILSTPQQDTICSGGTVTLNANASGGTGVITYNWQPPSFLDNPADSTLANPTASPASSTSFQVILSSGGCSKSVYVPVIVSPNSNPGWSVPPSFCSSATPFNLNTLITGDAGGVWSGTGVTDSIFDPTALNGSYPVTYSIGAGLCANDSTQNIIVNTAPAVILQSGSAIACTGSVDTLIVSGATTYTWSTGSSADSTILTLSNPGTYTYTVTGSNGGCVDSLDIVVTVNPSSQTNNPQTICAGGSYSINGNTYTIAGTYNDTLTTTTGCDSIVTTNLTVLAAITNTIDTTLCSGQSITVGSNTYSASGNYTDVIVAANGCDSTVTTNLTVNLPISSSQIVSLCAGQSITVGTNTYSATGVYTDIFTAANGCDSTVTTDLTVNPAISGSQTLSLCTGQSVTVGTNTYTSTGVYTDTLFAANGCDSIVTTDLTVNSVITNNIAVSICQGDSVFVQGAYQSASGIFNDTLTAAAGCDSVVVTNLAVNPVVITNPVTIICQGDSVFLAGAYQTTSGTYNDTMSTSLGCDSIISTTLTVNPVVITNQAATICQGDSILLGGSYQTTSGTYNDTMSTSLGCDSIIVTSLTVNPVVVTNQTIIICQGDSVFLEDAYQTTAGTYNDTLSTSLGCDSIITTALTVNPVVITNQSTVICQGDSVFLEGAYQTTSGTYNDTMNTSLGCDSIIITVLTVNPVAVTNQTATICQGDSVLLGGAYQTTAGTYNDTLSTSFGCDSIIITALTVNPVPQPAVMITNDTTVCEGQMVVINASSATAGATINVYTGGALVSTSVPYTTPALAINATYTVEALITGGCAQSSAFDSIQITVNTSPLNPTITATNSPLCEGASTQILASPAGNTYDIYPSSTGGAIMGQANVTLFSPVATTTYFVETTSANGCKTISGRDSIIIVVNPAPVAPSVQASNDSVCYGTQATINTNPSGPVYNVYDALTGGNLVGTIAAGQTSMSFTPTATITYYVEAISTNNCPQLSPRVPDTITVNPLPALVSNGTVTSATCEQNNGSIIGVSAGATGYTYVWTNTTTNVVTGTGSDLNNVPPGSYKVNITDIGTSCSAEFTYTVGNLSTVLADISASPTSGTVPKLITFTNTTVGALTYEWTFGNGDTDTSKSPTHKYYVAGTYEVVLTAHGNGSCIDRDTVVITLTDSLYPPIYPNIFSPNADGSNDVFFISSNMLSELHVDIFNRWGNKVFEYDGVNNGWDGRTYAGQEAADGDYYFILTGKFKDGKEIPEDKRKGFVRVVR